MDQDNGSNCANESAPPSIVAAPDDDDVQLVTGDLTTDQAASTDGTTTTPCASTSATVPADSLESQDILIIDVSEPLAATPPAQVDAAEPTVPSDGEVVIHMPPDETSSNTPEPTAAEEPPPTPTVDGAAPETTPGMPADAQNDAHEGVTASIILHCLCIVIALLSLFLTPLFECLALCIAPLFFLFRAERDHEATQTCAGANLCITFLVCAIWLGVVTLFTFTSFAILAGLVVFLIPYLLVMCCVCHSLRSI